MIFLQRLLLSLPDYKDTSLSYRDLSRTICSSSARKMVQTSVKSWEAGGVEWGFRLSHRSGVFRFLWKQISIFKLLHDMMNDINAYNAFGCIDLSMTILVTWYMWEYQYKMTSALKLDSSLMQITGDQRQDRQKWVEPWGFECESSICLSLLTRSH